MEKNGSYYLIEMCVCVRLSVSLMIPNRRANGSLSRVVVVTTRNAVVVNIFRDTKNVTKNN